MTAKRRTRAMAVLAGLLGSFGVLLMAAEKPEIAQNGDAGLELVVNGDFDGPLTPQGPTGWVKAMSPARTDGLRAGLEQVPRRGNVAFIEQAGVKVRVVNNWAQRIRTIPVGGTVRVTADVKTQNVPAGTGVVMVQCWDAAERLLGGASSQSVAPIGGTTDWKRVSFDFVVPPGTDTLIIRCGLAESGKIWFDNIAMNVISAGTGAAGGPLEGPANRGFEATAESLKQLQRIQTVSDALVAYAQQELGAEVRVRREVFAQGGGRFQVVLQLDVAKPQ